MLQVLFYSSSDTLTHGIKKSQTIQIFFTLAATYNNETIGVLIAEIRERRKCNKEVRNLSTILCELLLKNQ